MRTRLLHATRRRSGAKALREQLLDTERIRIGRASDSHVFVNSLSVALEHAVLREHGGELRVEAIGSNDVRVNGHVTRAGLLQPGDVVRIGPCEIRVLERGEDVDCAVEVETSPDVRSAAASGSGRSRVSLREIMPSARWTSWVLVLTIGALFLALPLRTLERVPGERDSAADEKPAQVEAPGALARFAISSWNPGALSDSHAAYTLSCETCHRERFRKVDDGACVECHATIGGHADSTVAGDAFDESHLRCAGCHVDHKGGKGLADVPDATCTDCHAELEVRFSETDLLDTSDFAAKHPEFRPSVVTSPGSSERTRSGAVASGGDEAQRVEHSGLKFSHEKHLESMQKKDKLTGKSIEIAARKCADCHAPDASSAVMRPIAYAQHCADASCHPLGFDNDYPDREAPHATPHIVRRAVEEFFAGRALSDDRRTSIGLSQPRQRPGKDELTESERLATKAWADDRATKALTALLSFGADGPCVKCHTLNSEGGDVTVTPVHVVPFEGGERWMPLAHFTHERHAQEDCERCHDVRASGTSEQILLPAIGVCRECHGGEAATVDRVASPCLQCHDFHHEKLGPMRATSSAEEAAVSGEQAR